MSLHEIWLQNQMQLPNERLLLKTADGRQVPISKEQLMTLISHAQPGESFTVGGLRFVVGMDGESIQVVSTSQADDAMPDNAPLGKSASQRKSKSSFGDFLLNEHRRNTARSQF